MLKKIKLAGIIFMVAVLVAVGLAGCTKDNNKDGKYDYNNNLVAESDLASLTAASRGVALLVFDGNNKLVFEQLTLGYVYNEKYVVVPNALFFAATPQGMVDVLKTEYKVGMFLLSDPGKEEDWKSEELVEIKFRNATFAVVERKNPALDVSKIKYTVGSYNDLKLGNYLYMVTQENSALGIKSSEVSRLHTVKNTNLISPAGNFLLQEQGSLIFALRKGKPELVGMLSVIGENIIGENGMVFVYALDINQIIEEIEKLK